MKISSWNKLGEKLQTFSLSHHDFPTIISNVSMLLRIITIDIYKKSKPISFIFYVTTTLALVAYFYVYTVSMVWAVVFFYGNAAMWTEVAVVLALSSCSVTCLTKFVFMKLYKKEINDTVDKFLKCDAQVISDTRFAKNLLMRLRAVKTRATIIWVSFVADGLVYILMPYLTPGRHFVNEIYLIYGLVPMLESPNYEIALLLTTITTGFGIYTMVSVAVYVIVIVGYAEAQLDALSEELRNVWIDSQNFYNEIRRNIEKRHIIYNKYRITNEFIDIRLRDIIKFHVIIIDLVRELDREFRPILGLECSITAFSIIAELLGGLKYTYLQLPFSLIHASMDCLAGQRLIDACNHFEEAAYDCGWENFSIKNQKKILIILRLSQKTLMLSAGGMAKLNFNFLMLTLKSTYSTYMTLESTVK